MARGGLTWVRRLAPVCLVCLFFLSCGKPAPIRLGFLGGLSGRSADLGVAGRNGTILAVEQQNAAGGIGGRPVELLVRDDEQKPEAAVRGVTELLGAKVEAIIGPMTSSMATAVVPLVNASSAILVSPTVTTKDLAGKDDSFLRVVAVTTAYAAKLADYQTGRLGRRRAVALYDTGNRSYTESWLGDFRNAFERGGGKLVRTTAFQSGPDVSFLDAVKELLREKPDLFVLVANAVDGAMICQQVRKLDSRVTIAASEWASTERFVELGGAAAEGAYVTQFLDRNDSSDRYLKFKTAYRERFGQEPGFAGVAGYDAAIVVLDALGRRKAGRPLKEAILSAVEYQGLQQVLRIDGFGDADRRTFVTLIRDGKYSTVE